MADTGTSTVVRITIDDSGVSSGINRVERSIANLGTTVGNSAAAAAGSVASIGNGANASAAAIDKATKNMAASIQHTTLIMDAGTRGTAEYYTALANAKGLNMATLRPYIEQLEQVTARTKAAAEANRRLEESTQFLESLKSRADAIGKTASQLAAMRAAELGVTSAAAPMIARLAEAEHGMQGVGMSAAATAAAMRNVPAQFTDMVVGIQSGQAPLTVLLQQGGQLNDMFGGVGNAAKAMGSYVMGLITPMTLAATAVGALAFAYASAHSESKELNKALILNGNSVVANAGKMQDMAISISKATEFTRGASVAALSEIATVGKVGALNLEGFARVAQQMEKTIGKSINETASDLAELGKAPTAATAKLNEKYQYLTTTIYKQIKALEDQGRANDAATLAQETYMSSMDSKTKLIKENLGYLETGWNKVASAAKNGWDSILDVGREDTLEQKMEKINNAIERSKTDKKVRNEARGQFGRGDFGIKLRPELEPEAVDKSLDADKAALTKQILLQDKVLAAENAIVLTRAAGVKWLDQGNQFLTKQQQLNKEIATTRNEGAAAGISEENINQRITQIKRKYADLNNVYIVSRENARNLEKEAFTGQLSSLEAQHNQMLLSDEKYFGAKRDIQLKDLDSEEALIRQQAKIAGGKEDLSERDRYLGQLKVMEQRRKNIINDAQKSIDQSAFNTGKAIDEQSAKWREATEAEQEMLEEEIRLYGKSADAKKIESAQLKVETELREFLDAAKKKNQTLMPHDIALKIKEAEVRGKNIKAIEGENIAMSAAGQLRAENEQFAIDAIFDDEKRAQAKLKREEDLYREKIRLAGEGTRAQKILQEEFDTWYQNQSIKPTIDAQKSMWKSIDDTAHDVFVNIFDGGKNAFDRLRDTLKAGLLDLLYQMTVKKWIFNIGASVTGGMVGSVANAATGGVAGGAATGMGALGTIAQMGSSLVSTFTGGLQVAYQKFALGSMGSSLGLSSMGVGSGTMVGGLPGTAGMVLPNVGPQLTTLGSIGSGIATAAPYIAAAVLLYKGLQMGEKQMTGQTVTGTVGGKDANNDLYRNVSWSQSGGFLRGDRSGTWSYNLANSTAMADGKPYVDSASLTADKALLGALTDSYDLLKKASADYAAALGLNAADINSRTDSISFAVGKDTAETQANISKMFEDIGNKIASDLLTPFSSLVKAGESASQTLTRLASDVKAADAFFSALSLSLPAATTANSILKANLVEAAGGLEKFNAGATFFVQNFLTEAEQMAPLINDVTAKMSSLGLASVTTVAQFKDTVKGIDFTTDAGIKLYAALQDIAPSFKTVADYTTKLGDANTAATNQLKNALQSINDSIQKEIDSLLASSQTVDQRRAAEKVGQDPTTILLLNKRNQLQDEIKAMQDAETAKQNLLALSKSRADLEIGLMRALGNEEGALARERQRTLESTTDALSKELLIKTYAAVDKKKADDEAKQKADAEAQARAAAAQAAAQALQTAQQEAERQAQAAKQAYDQHISDLRSKLQTAYNKESSALTDIINKTQSFADAAHQAADAMTFGALSPLSDKQKYDMLKTSLPEIIGRANAFDPEALGQLQQFTELSKLTSNTFDEYTSDINLVYSTLVGSAATAQTQVSIAKASLDVMKTQVDALLNVDQGIGSVADQIAALNAAMAAGLSGVASAVYGQYQANNPASSAGAIKTSAGPTPQEILDAGPKQAILTSVYARYRESEEAYGKMVREAQAAGYKGTEQDYTNEFGGRFDLEAEKEKALAAWTLSRIPKFAKGGYHAGGLRLVGEVGAELEVTGPARYYNAAQTASLLRSGGADNTEVVAELKAMAARLEAIEANTQATAGHSNRSANVLEDASDGDALLMRAGT